MADWQITMLFVESILSLEGRGFVEWRDVWLLEDRFSLTQDFIGRQEFAVGSCLLKRVPGGQDFTGVHSEL